MSYLDWHAGMKVVCVDNAPFQGCRWPSEDEIPVVGNHYTISSVMVDDEGLVIVHLEELKRSKWSVRRFGPLAGYAAWRFRPVQTRKTDISIFTAMLDRVPSQKERA
ncbi:MAG: hypothetical protein M9944_12800 [Rhizobiaceae bacterium]|nr:hypothetical protein [Rhizobiaceae bacterium]